MFWDVLVTVIFVVSYTVSLVVFLLKRPDRRLASKRERTLIRFSVLFAGLLIAWFTISLIIELVE